MFFQALFLCLSLLFCSCSQVTYLWEQGLGQFKLQNRAKDNEKVLRDPLVPKEMKRQIALIQTYKNYFYEYFVFPPKSIYSRTTILENKAVSYLVIASSPREVKALEHCFPFMGCFPYLGFFKEQSAKDFEQSLQGKGLVTYRRPVYGYSTLGYFEDTILSSFFQFQDFELAELIFHELFHTVFFVKNDVDANEALATYFGHEMAKTYYQENHLIKEKALKKMERQEELSLLVVALGLELENLYQGLEAEASAETFALTLERFLQERFFPSIRDYCGRYGLTQDSCYPLKIQWNNASFSAFMTYEKDLDVIQLVQEKKSFGLSQLLTYLQSIEQQFLKLGNKEEMLQIYQQKLKDFYQEEKRKLWEKFPVLKVKRQKKKKTSIQITEEEVKELKYMDYLIIETFLKN